MIALHKPQRATYGQAVKAQDEYLNVVCGDGTANCWDPGTKTCC